VILEVLTEFVAHLATDDEDVVGVRGTPLLRVEERCPRGRDALHKNSDDVTKKSGDVTTAFGLLLEPLETEAYEFRLQLVETSAYPGHLVVVTAPLYAVAHLPCLNRDVGA
jgi:hypothetical protein